ncbi:MAG: hypothetical protein JWN95_3025 [Frankiales bacterium]|nr:hypothetical protein [Frankiales bacterium]
MAESVLVTALRPDGMSDGVWAKASARSLVDCGDHLEWRDGSSVHRWRLADQPASAELPELAGVSKVLVPSPIQDTYIGTRVEFVFTSPSGGFLASLNGGVTRDRKYTDKAYPDEVFAGLVARGVPVTEERIASYREFRRRHPGEPSTGVSGLARRLGYAWS